MRRAHSWIFVANGLLISCAQGEGGGESFGASLQPGGATNGASTTGDDGDSSDASGNGPETDSGPDSDADSGTDSDGDSVGDETGAPDTCGNGALDPGEVCDGVELDGQDCTSQGAGTGVLACAPNCLAFDTTSCNAGVCGDGTIDATEACDGGNLGASTCASAGFDSGTLACDAACGLDTSSCGTCGNAVVDGDEECDGVAPQDCAALGLGAGPVACTACVTDTSGCVSEPEEVNFPIATDSSFTSAGGPPWNDGDFYQGDRNTGIPSFDRVDIHLALVSNSLSACGVQSAQVSINGTAVGTFSVTQGNTVIDASFPVAPSIVGPSYTIRYETTATVAQGCGSAGYATSGSTVTFFPG